MFRFGVLSLLEVLPKDTEAQGGQPSPGSFVLTSSLATNHRDFTAGHVNTPPEQSTPSTAPNKKLLPDPSLDPEGQATSGA